MYTVTLDFGAGAVDYSAYLEGRFPVRRTRAVHNGLKPVIGMCRFAFKRNATLANAFLTASADPAIVVLKDGGPYFKGTARRNVKAIVGSMNLDALQVECVDALYRLDSAKALTSSVWANYKISDPTTKTASILHQLFYGAGFVDAELDFTAISTVVDRYTIDGTKKATYRSLIETVLRDAVYSCYVDQSGIVHLYDLAPATITTTLDLTTGIGGNIAEGYSVQRSEMREKAVDVTYWTRETKAGAVVFKDTSGASATLPCSISLAAGAYYPTGAASGKSVRAKFDIQDREIISVDSPTLAWAHTGDVTLEASTVDGLGMLLRFHSATGGVITKLEITGTAVLKADECKVEKEIVAATQEREEIESIILASKTDASRVAVGRALWHEFGQWRHEFRRVLLSSSVSADSLFPSATLYPSTTLFPWSDITQPGEYAALSDTAILGATQTLRVVEVTDGDDPRAFRLVAEGASAYSAATLVETIQTLPKPLAPNPHAALKSLANDPAGGTPDTVDYTGQHGVYAGMTYEGTTPSTWARITVKRYADVANTAERNALAGMIAGDSVFQIDTLQWYIYTSSWVTNGPALTPGGIGADPTGTAAGLVPRFRGSLASDPASDNRSGDYYYNTASHKIRAYTSAWADASAAFTAAGVGADPTGTAAGLVPRFRGSLTTDPATDNREGDYYYNTTSQKIRAYVSSAWADASGKILTAAEVATAVVTYAPKYLGRVAYASLAGTAGNEGDTITAYSATIGECGIYKMISGTWTDQTSPTTEMIAAAWLDIVWATNNSYPSTGTASEKVQAYMGSGVNYFETLAANSAFFTALKAVAAFFQDITVTGKALLSELVLANVTAGTNIVRSIDTETTISATSSYAKIVEKQFCASGVIRVSWQFKGTRALTSPLTYSQIWVNGVAKADTGGGSTEHTITTNDPYGTAVTEDIAVNAGDLVQIYMYIAGGGSSMFVQNFRLQINEQAGILKYLGTP